MFNRAELEKRISWDEYDVGHLVFPIPPFELDVPFELHELTDPPRRVTEAMVASTNQALAPGPDTVRLIKLFLWESSVLNFLVADFGFPRQGGETKWQAISVS